MLIHRTLKSLNLYKTGYKLHHSIYWNVCPAYCLCYTQKHAKNQSYFFTIDFLACWKTHCRLFHRPLTSRHTCLFSLPFVFYRSPKIFQKPWYASVCIDLSGFPALKSCPCLQLGLYHNKIYSPIKKIADRIEFADCLLKCRTQIHKINNVIK